MRRFGLIGKSLSHSFSQSYFTNKFSSEQISNVSYENFELDKIEHFVQLFKIEELVGLNVTIPYKESILPFLDELDPIAKAIGAVNTIHFQPNGKLKGYNTDAIGFRNSIKPFLDTNHTRALIFGTGGASKAVAHTLNELQIPFYYVSRKPRNSQHVHYNDVDKSAIERFKFLINCTPLGTYPNIEQSVPIDFDGITTKHLVYDLVYNPEETFLLREAKKRKAIAVNGLSMLKLQAEASWEIWNNH